MLRSLRTDPGHDYPRCLFPLLLALACRSPGVAPVDDTGGDTSPPPEDAPAESVPDVGVGCGLTTNLAEPWVVEGDEVRFTVSCSGPTATEDVEFTLLDGPDDLVFDPATRRVTWTPFSDDAGTFTLSFELTVGDRRGVEQVELHVVDDPFVEGGTPPDPLRYDDEWGLPVIHIHASGTPTTEVVVDATVTFQGVEYPALFQVHGRTSSHYPKLSYALEFDEAELPVPAWGVTRDHLLLITPFDDNAYVRQPLTYAVWAEMAATEKAPRIAPRYDFVVVYLDDVYLGLYLLEDKVDDELADHCGFNRDGNLYKAITPDANYDLVDEYGKKKKNLHQGFEKKEGLPEDDWSDLDELVGFAGTSDAATIVAGLPERVEPTEFQDWFVLVHYVNGEDSTNKNHYLYRDPHGGRFFVVPWDFNASWGQNWRTYRRDPAVDNEFRDNNRVFAAMLDADADALWARAAFHREGPLGLDWQLAWLDETFAHIDRSAQRDWSKWEDSYYSYDGWAAYREEHADWTDYEGEKAYLYDWVRARDAWFAGEHP